MNNILKVVENKELIKIYSCLQPEMFEKQFWIKLQKKLQNQIFEMDGFGSIKKIKCKINTNRVNLILGGKNIIFNLDHISDGYLWLANSKINPNLSEFDDHIYICNLSSTKSNTSIHAKLSIKYNIDSINQMYNYWLNKEEIVAAQKLIKNPTLTNFI